MEMSLQLQAIIAALIALAFIYKLSNATAKAKKNSPPEPRGSLADKYGPALLIRLGARPALVISSWELTKECFTTNDKVLAGRPKFEVCTQMAFNNAALGFAPYGAYWRDMRKITVLELLSTRQLDTLKHVRATEVRLIMKDLYGLWEKNGKKAVQVEMTEKFGDITFNVIAMMVIGKRCFGSLSDNDDGDSVRFREATEEWFHLFGAFVPSDVFPFLKWWEVKGYKKEMRRVFHTLDALLSKWLEEHRETMGDQDFLDVLISHIDASHSTDYDVDTMIKVTALIGETVLTGGYDTTSVSSTWTLSLLLSNKQALRKAQEELDRHVGRDRNVEESDLNNLVYLQAIVKESLRLYPSAPLSGPHESTEDCYVGGYFIPAGTRLLVNLWKLHRDPRVWSDPEVFRPERFLTENADVEGKGSHFQYLPFGAGRRMCPGYILAHQLLHLTFARLLHGFELSTPGDGPVDMTEGSGLTAPKATPLEVSLPDGLTQLQSLENLKIVGCDKVPLLPEGLGQLKKLRSLRICHLESLERLKILDSKNLQSLPEGLGELKKLKSLEIRNAEALICLPNSLVQLESLEQLHISGLKKLDSLPQGLERFKKLKSLKIRGVEVLTFPPNSLGQLESLEELEMDCLKKFELPLEGLGQLKKLESLTIGGDEELTCLPDSLGQLESLEYFEIIGLAKLESLPHSLAQLKKLRRLKTRKMEALINIPSHWDSLSR
ncbi:hypothetical protein ACLOJK_019236 [Asimina triloba]